MEQPRIATHKYWNTPDFSTAPQPLTIEDGWARFHERPLIHTDFELPVSSSIPDILLADPLKSSWLSQHAFLVAMTSTDMFVDRLRSGSLRGVHHQLFWDIATVVTNEGWEEIDQIIAPHDQLDLFIRFCCCGYKKNKHFSDWPERIIETGEIQDYDFIEADYRGYKLAYAELLKQLEGWDIQWARSTQVHPMGFDAFLKAVGQTPHLLIGRYATED